LAGFVLPELKGMKWADYAITAVKFQKERVHIEQVKARPCKENELGPETTMSRDAVVAYLEKGKTFATVVNKNGQNIWGAKIGIVEIDGIKFIRTDRDNTKADNLGELPEF
jgi:hypothetical protein